LAKGRRARAVGGRPGQLTRVRNAWGLRVTDVEALSGVTSHTLRLIDRGQIDRVPLGALARVAVALGVRPTDLVPALGAQPPKQGCPAARLVASRRELGKTMRQRFGGVGLDRASHAGRYAHGVPAGRLEVPTNSPRPPQGPEWPGQDGHVPGAPDDARPEAEAPGRDGGDAGSRTP